MYSRTNSVTMTVPRESFGFSRSTEPEVFTFERIPAQATAVRSFVPIRPKKRCTRVMYPAKVRMHLPPPEKSQAKRWLVILCLVVLWQIYTEEPCAADSALGACADSPVGGDFQGFSFQSAEEQARQLDSELLLSSSSSSSSASNANSCEDDGSASDPSTTCPAPAQEADSSRSYEQSAAGNGYMVALLVYHRLGSDN